MADPIDYQGPPRRPEDVVASALANDELMRQVESALDEERRGIPAVPLRQIIEEQRRRRAS